MGLSSPRLRGFVRHALVAATDVASPDAAQLGAAFHLLCDQLWMRLRPLFGELAIKALFVRALHAAQAEFPWLEGLSPAADDGCRLDGFDTLSRDLDPHMLVEGLAAILADEIGLLSAFIGDDVVLPLVEQSWGPEMVGRRTGTEGDQ
ncbi:MAG TPA: hypothetical protein VMO26_25905 [Vicinamibacterales bacterium]|nr:hypothetical protein [Vicinamibacterales bacterium]